MAAAFIIGLILGVVIGWLLTVLRVRLMIRTRIKVYRGFLTNATGYGRERLGAKIETLEHLL